MSSIQTERIPGLQAVRAIAALLVVLFHVSEYLNKYWGASSAFDVFRFGHLGVPIFFVISGFILVAIHGHEFGHPPRVRSYLLKRAIRIYPPMVAVVIPLVFACAFAVRCGTSYFGEVETVVATLLLWPQNHAPYLGVAWTLCHEVFFYALFAFAIANRRLGLGLLVAWSLACATYSAISQEPAYPNPSSDFPLNFILSSNNLYFCLGVLLAIARDARRDLARPWMFLAGIALLPAFAVAEGGSAVLAGIVAGACSALLVLGGVGLASSRWLALPEELGNASYAMYLVHTPIFNAMLRLFHPGSLDPFVMGSVSLVCVVAASIAFYRLLERPVTLALRRALLVRAAPQAGGV